MLYSTVLNVLAPGTGFVKEHFSTDWGDRMVSSDDSSAFMVLLLLLLLSCFSRVQLCATP